MEDTLVLITTYIGSGITDPNFIDERINILRLSTIPSLLAQTQKNFVWMVYLDKYNNPPESINKLEQLFNNYNKYINIYLNKYVPLLQDGSLCVHNRARSCCSKRWELYNEGFEWCVRKGFLNKKTYIAHLMLDDDDPILPTHIQWINSTVRNGRAHLKFNKATIAINKIQWIFYLDMMKLMKIESTKALKGSSFIFYKTTTDPKFHPYTIIETIQSNMAYKNKYNINTIILSNQPTWVYFRHRTTTSTYRKEFIIKKLLKTFTNIDDIVHHLKFYSRKSLNELRNVMKAKKQSPETTKWVKYRKKDNTKLMMNESMLELGNYLKNNFIIEYDNEIEEGKMVLENNIYLVKDKEYKDIYYDLMSLND